jgi:FAD/FMN-containing dehydrogenase
VEAFFDKHPQIPFVTPTSPVYRDIRAAYIKDSPITPLGIARPRTAEDVAAVVAFAAARGIEISVRTGGHDLFGRAFVQGGLAIDMRELAYAKISEDRKTVRIGGGTLAIAVTEALTAEGLATAVGSFPTVGFVGWATLGGYGPFAPNYGLGVDQIVGAKIVNGEGRVVDADEDMAVALRGGGGALGVVVEMTVNVYPLKNVSSPFLR